jgi:hypothetical protein
MTRFLEEEAALITGKHTKSEWNLYYRTVMGYGLPRKSLNVYNNRLQLGKLANVLMNYRLCDILTWTVSDDVDRNVPIHCKKTFKVLSRSVSCS